MKKTTVNTWRLRKRILLILLVMTPAGFLFKFYSGPGHSWFNNHGAGVLYEMFWILVVLFMAPRKRALPKITLCVLVVTCLLECLQLWHPPLLQTVRSTFLGAALMGTTFVWWDFPHYVLGCAIGWLLADSLARGVNHGSGSVSGR